MTPGYGFVEKLAVSGPGPLGFLLVDTVATIEGLTNRATTLAPLSSGSQEDQAQGHGTPAGGGRYTLERLRRGVGISLLFPSMSLPGWPPILRP